MVLLSKTAYNTLHKWMLRGYKKRGVCLHCKAQTVTQWANKTGNYERKRDDWLELCPACHGAYDANRRDSVYKRKRQAAAERRQIMAKSQADAARIALIEQGTEWYN